MATQFINQITPLGQTDSYHLRASGVKYLIGSGTAAVTTSPYTYSKWQFNDTSISSYEDGLMIAIKVPVAGNGTYGTCLQINSLGFHPVVTQTNSMISTRYAVGAIILLVYTSSLSQNVYSNSATAASISGVWVVVNDYDSGNDYEYLRTANGRMYVGTGGIYRYNLVAQDTTKRFSGFVNSASTGTSKTINTSNKYVLPAVIYFYNANNDNTTVGDLVSSTYATYAAHYAVDTRYSHNHTTTFTVSTPLYIECTIDENGYWSPTTVCITQTFRSGYYYIFLGLTYSTEYQLSLSPYHPVYYYDGTNLVPYGARFTSMPTNGEILIASGTNGGIESSGYTVSSLLSLQDAMVFKGTLGTGGTTTALPATHEAGWTYRVITAGTYAGKVCEVGDLIICVTDGTAANDAHWTVAQTNIDGAVTGPTSSTDGNFALFNGTTGKIIKNSSYKPSDFYPASNPNEYTSNVGTITSITAGTGLTTTSGSATDGGNITSTGTLYLTKTAVTAGSYGPSADATPAHEGTFSVPYITIDAYGRITGASTKTITLPSDSNILNTAGATDTSSKIFLIGATAQNANPQTYSDNEVYATSGVLTAKTFSGSGASLTSLNASNISSGTLAAARLPSVTRTNNTSTASPAHAATFTAIDSITTDTYGRVTAVNTKTVTLPSDNNTDTKVNVVARGTTKSYLMADTTSPTSTAAAHTAVAETGIYMTTTAGELNATQYKVNEAVTLQYNSTTKSLDFIFA